MQEAHDTVWTQIEKIHQQIDGPKAYVADSIILTTSYSYRLVVSILEACIVMTPTRTSFALVEMSLKDGNFLKTSLYVGGVLAVYTVSYSLISSYADDIKESADNLYLYIEDGAYLVYEGIYPINKEIEATGDVIPVNDEL